MDQLSETTLPPDPQGPSPIAPTPDLTGKTLGDFHVLRRLGEGGMGQVFLAEQLSLKRKVALKLLKADLAANATALQRFKAEAEAVARATHANIVQVYAIGEDAGLHYMALEYVEGRNLRDYLAKKGPPDVPIALSIMRQCAAALQRASELGIVHRDIKPDNILLTRKGEVKIADFGLSRDLSGEGQPLNLTASGVTMGTPLYMSPEQVKGQKVDSRTDIYSLGVTCFHMLAGEPPFRGATAFDVALKHVQADPPPLQKLRPDAPAELCAVVQKMMAKNPDDRYQTGRDLMRDLTLVRDGLGGVTASQLFADVGEAGKTLLEARPAPAARRSLVLPLVVIASLVIALIAGVGAGFGWFHRPSTSAPPPPANSEPTPADSAISPQKREQSLKEVVAQYSNPGKEPAKVAAGYELNMNLGLFYLEQKRWDDADKFFQELMKNPHQVEAYMRLGRLGHAIVAGLQNKAKESIDLFRNLLPDKAEGLGGLAKGIDMGLRDPKFRQWIGEALEYDFKNDHEYYAKYQMKLDSWRKPPATAPK
jgi:eukaryotic-like serine/threonine-protein kinase